MGTSPGRAELYRVSSSSQIISVTGFVDGDRDDLKLMAYLAGAKYTGYLCRSNTVLICRE